MYFEMLLDITTHSIGEKNIMIRIRGTERKMCTIMLYVMADGTKLLAYAVFKRKKF